MYNKLWFTTSDQGTVERAVISAQGAGLALAATFEPNQDGSGFTITWDLPAYTQVTLDMFVRGYVNARKDM
jgi:hypothetical protein